MKYYRILIDNVWSGDRPKCLKKIQGDYEHIVNQWKGHKVEIAESPPFLDEYLVKNRIRNKTLTITDKDGNEKRYSKIQFKTEHPNIGWVFHISGHHCKLKVLYLQNNILEDLVWKKVAYDNLSGMMYKLS